MIGLTVFILANVAFIIGLLALFHWGNMGGRWTSRPKARPSVTHGRRGDFTAR